MTLIGPSVRYPAGPITDHGGYYLLNNRIPWVALRAYDDSVVFNLMGGLAIPDRTLPERVELKSMSGLIPPWKTIDQKGASQDGVSFVDSLYDPISIKLGLRAVGRDPAHLRQVVSDLVASMDAKQEAELSWFTHKMGRWWSKVRWEKTIDEDFSPVQRCDQNLTLRLRADTGFWESYPHVDQFRFTYLTDNDGFDYLTAPGDPITGWTLAYSGGGSGVLYTDGNQAVSTLANNKTVVARRTSFTASTDNVVLTLEMGANAQPTWPRDTYIDGWARMNNTGTPGTDGIRWRMGRSSGFFSPLFIRLSSFSGGVETLIREVRNLRPAAPGEKFTLITGVNEDSRMYTILRNNATLFKVKETGTTSIINSSHRKAGFGAATLSGLVRPIGLRSWSVGDNNTVTQQGFLERVNVGDQPMWDRYTCFGPGKFSFGNGPDSTEFVTFGPLLHNQVMQIRTDPRKRGVIDMTAIPPTPQDIALFKKASGDFLSFLSTRNVPTNPGATQSIFGITPPQGNPYSLLKGRFSRPIPARSPGAPVQSYHVLVKIDDGNSDSQIIAAGTPLRRQPY